ncbi:MAG: methyl-accepting chemotaxis protein, partial [Phormidesmis sp.]
SAQTLAEENQTKIDTIIPELDQIVVGLTEGSEELQLVKLSDAEFQANMQQLTQAWEELKDKLANYRVSSTEQNRDRLLEASEAYWDLTNQTVFSAEAYAKEHIRQSKQMALVLFIVSLVILASVFYLIEQIRKHLEITFHDLTTSTSEISVTVTQQERVANQQAASVNETTTTMNELETSSRQSTEQANTAVAAANKALQRTQDGSQAVEKTIEGMFILDQKVGAIAEKIVALSDQASQIAKISELSAEFANRTNMLALNSSVEAVRAGEHGKGFAVVAEEIRRLSDQSQRSAEEISGLVNEIQRTINATVMVTEEGTKTVRSGVENAKSAEKAFQAIEDSTNTVVLNNQQVMLTLKQQFEAMHQVVEAMSAIEHGSRENASGLSETKSETERLRQTAINIKAMA